MGRSNDVDSSTTLRNMVSVSCLEGLMITFVRSIHSARESGLYIGLGSVEEKSFLLQVGLWVVQVKVFCENSLKPVGWNHKYRMKSRTLTSSDWRAHSRAKSGLSRDVSARASRGISSLAGISECQSNLAQKCRRFPTDQGCHNGSKVKQIGAKTDKTDTHS